MHIGMKNVGAVRLFGFLCTLKNIVLFVLQCIENDFLELLPKIPMWHAKFMVT